MFIDFHLIYSVVSTSIWDSNDKEKKKVTMFSSWKVVKDKTPRPRASYFLKKEVYHYHLHTDVVYSTFITICEIWIDDFTFRLLFVF